MQGRHSALHIALDNATRATLQGWLRQQKTPWPRQTGAGHFTLGRRPDVCHHRSICGTSRTACAQMDAALCHTRHRGVVRQKTPRPTARFFPRWWRCMWSSWPASVLTCSDGPCRKGIVRTGPAGGPRRRGRRHLAADRATDARVPQAQTLASSSVAVPPGSTRCRFCGPGTRNCHPLYTPLGVWEMVLCVDEKTSLAPDTQSAHLSRPTGQPVRVEHE